MYITLFEDGYVQGFSPDEGNLEMFEISDEIVPDDFEENFMYYRYDGEILIFDKDRKKDSELEQKKEEIRQHREETCFPIINRGGLWYDLLSEAERSELLEWYMAWLDAPESLIEPEMPEWLKEMI